MGNSETSASEPLMKHRKQQRVTSKPGLVAWSGKNPAGACWLDSVRCTGVVTLFQALLGNVGTSRADDKGEIQVGKSTRMSVPMRRTGAEQLVVVMKLL